MNYAEYYDGKKIKTVESTSVCSAETQGFLPIVLDLSAKKEKEIPVYYENTEVVSFFEYFLIFALQLIPVVGLGFILYLAFSKGENSPKRTMARAMLATYALLAVVVAFALLL